MPPGLITFGIICAVLWAMLAFLIVMAQPIRPYHDETLGLAALLLFMFGPPVAGAVIILLFARRRRWRRQG